MTYDRSEKQRSTSFKARLPPCPTGTRSPTLRRRESLARIRKPLLNLRGSIRGKIADQVIMKIKYLCYNLS